MVGSLGGVSRRISSGNDSEGSESWMNLSFSPDQNHGNLKVLANYPIENNLL